MKHNFFTGPFLHPTTYSDSMQGHAAQSFFLIWKMLNFAFNLFLYHYNLSKCISPLSFYISIFFEMTQITNLGWHISEKTKKSLLQSSLMVSRPLNLHSHYFNHLWNTLGIDFFKNSSFTIKVVWKSPKSIEEEYAYSKWEVTTLQTHKNK